MDSYGKRLETEGARIVLRILIPASSHSSFALLFQSTMGVVMDVYAHVRFLSRTENAPASIIRAATRLAFVNHVRNFSQDI